MVITPAPIAQCTDVSDARLRFLSDGLHQLGPRALFEFIRELLKGADITSRLEAYAKISHLAFFISELEGEQVRDLRIVKGGRQ